MFRRLRDYLLLPSELSDFERSYLARMNRIGFYFFASHIPVFTLIAAFNGTNALLAFGLTTFLVSGPILASRFLSNPRHVSITFGFLAMGLGGLLVHFGQGPMQIEMHFYFFVLIALLAVFANPAVILTAAVTAAVHHLTLWVLLPRSVFNYDASIWTVVVHALFVVLESIAACFVARSFFDDVIGLDHIVQLRTAEVEAKNAAMRLVFDTVDQGFVTIDRAGVMSPERSAVVARWLGPAPASELLADYLEPVSARFAASFRLGWEAVIDDVLPLELNLAQLPSEVAVGERILRLAYTPILEGDALVRVLVVMTDITAERGRELAEIEQRDILHVVDRILRDKAGFLEFLAECEGMIEALREGTLGLAQAKRLIHTLKGNAAIYGLGGVSSAWHLVEDRMEESGLVPGEEDLAGVFELWGAFRGRLSGLLGEELRSRVELDDAEYAEILSRAMEGAPPQELAERIRSWKREPVRKRLARVAEQARSVAERLGKPGLEIDVEDAGIRLEAGEWAPFWSSFVHVVRNAVDHGIEPRDERVAKGKPAEGRLVLGGVQDGDAFVVSITDDGRGISWSKLRERALEHGLPAATHDDLVQALFADGVSTRDEASEYSGRGVGMGAVASACMARGGSVSVESTPDRGTTVRFLFPGVFEQRAAA